jgi:hypothetical protein
MVELSAPQATLFQSARRVDHHALIITIDIASQIASEGERLQKLTWT